MTPTHVYQPGPGSQMMMIPGQQLPFPSSAQGAAYFIPGQVGRGGGAQTGEGSSRDLFYQSHMVYGQLS